MLTEMSIASACDLCTPTGLSSANRTQRKKSNPIGFALPTGQFVFAYFHQMHPWLWSVILPLRHPGTTKTACEFNLCGHDVFESYE